MRRLRSTHRSAPRHRAARVATAARAAAAARVAAAAGLAAALLVLPSAARASWLQPKVYERVVSRSSNVRIALTPGGGVGALAWGGSDDGTSNNIRVRTFGPDTVSTLPSGFFDTVARDGSGHVMVGWATSGGEGSNLARVAIMGPGGWQRMTVDHDSFEQMGTALGLQNGFAFGVETDHDAHGVLTSSLRINSLSGDGVLTRGAAIPTVNPFLADRGIDQTFGTDGTAWSLVAPNTVGTIVASPTGQATETDLAPSAASFIAAAPGSQTPLVQPLPPIPPIVNSDHPNVGATSIDTAGSHVAVAGLDVTTQGITTGTHGYPVVALGTAAGLGAPIRLPYTTVASPARKATTATTVDVAAMDDGGAFVTYLDHHGNVVEAGTPNWAYYRPGGQFGGGGVLGSGRVDRVVRDLRIVRAGSGALAVWRRGVGTKARFAEAVLSPSGTTTSIRHPKAPPGIPLGFHENYNTSQLVSDGTHIALVYIDRPTNRIRLAEQTVATAAG